MDKETKRQLVGLVISVASVAAVSLADRYSKDPDGLRTLRMRWNLGLKKISGRVGEYASRKYDEDCA